MDKYILSIIVPGFSCYEVIEIDTILDMGDCYNIVWGDNELFVDKDRCIISGDNIIYKSNNIEVYIEAA